MSVTSSEKTTEMSFLQEQNAPNGITSDPSGITTWIPSVDVNIAASMSRSVGATQRVAGGMVMCFGGPKKICCSPQPCPQQIAFERELNEDKYNEEMKEGTNEVSLPGVEVAALTSA